MKEPVYVSIQGMGDIWLYELSNGAVKWREPPYVNRLNKEFKEMIEKKELDHFVDANKMVQTTEK